DPRVAAFDSWCDRPAGWLERCRVTLTLASQEDSTAMTAVFPSGDAVRLRTFPGDASFRYVARDSAGTRWLDTWGRGITVPFALGGAGAERGGARVARARHGRRARSAGRLGELRGPHARGGHAGRPERPGGGAVARAGGAA